MKIRYFTKIFTGTLILLATSCQKDFLDINTDPNLPTTAELPEIAHERRIQRRHDVCSGILYGFYTSFLRSPPDFPGSG